MIMPHSDSVGMAAAALPSGAPGPPGSVIKPAAGLLSPAPLSVMVKLIWLPLTSAPGSTYQCGVWLAPNSGPNL